jgi:uncharacterized protein (TIGR00106 family)
MSASNGVASLATPPSCIADFCLIPLGTPTASVSKEVAEVQRVLKRSGLTYSMHSAGTTVGMTLHTPFYVVYAFASEPTPFSAGMRAWWLGGVYGIFLNAYTNWD